MKTILYTTHILAVIIQTYFAVLNYQSGLIGIFGFNTLFIGWSLAALLFMKNSTTQFHAPFKAD